MPCIYARKKPVFLYPLLFAFTVGIAISCTGCGGGPKKPELMKIAIWGGPKEVEMLNSIMEEWKAEHPDVDVNLQHTPAGEYKNKLMIRIAGGTAPDVMFCEAGDFVSFMAMSPFMDLTPFIEGDDEFDINDFFPEVVRRFTRDGKIFSIPRDTAPFACVYYNKELFDDAGVSYPSDDWDWAGMLEKAQALTKYNEEGRIEQYGFYGWTWENFVYSNGGSLVDDVENPAEFTLSRPESIEGLQFYADLINKYRVCPSPTDLGNLGMGAQQLFMSGKLAMYQSGIWETPLLREITGFDWDVALFPKGPGGIRRFGTGGSGYCVLRTTRYPEMAWSIVKALSGPSAQVALADMGLTQPAIISISEGPHFAKSDAKPLNKKVMNEAVQYVVYEPFHGRWREIRELYINPELDLVFAGKMTAEEAITKVAAKADELLQN